MRMNKIFIAGHRGMVGSSINRILSTEPNNTILTASREELDLTNQTQVFEFIGDHDIDQIYLAAAKVGGIHANNTYPADFIYNNLMIEANVIHASYLNKVKKLLFLGSSCIYPKFANQPIQESALLSDYLESTNEPYAIAKIAGIKLCESYNRQYGQQYGIDYRSIMPANLYGPGDNYHPDNSHVVPALIRRFHEAKTKNLDEVIVWGSGKPRREFLHVDDMARASIFLNNIERKELDVLTSSMCSHVNAGFGSDVTIKELSELIKDIVDFKGKIIFDSSKPDGPPKKLVDSKILNKLGWEAQISLKEGISQSYNDFLENYG